MREVDSSWAFFCWKKKIKSSNKVREPCNYCSRIHFIHLQCSSLLTFLQHWNSQTHHGVSLAYSTSTGAASFRMLGWTGTWEAAGFFLFLELPGFAQHLLPLIFPHRKQLLVQGERELGEEKGPAFHPQNPGQKLLHHICQQFCCRTELGPPRCCQGREDEPPHSPQWQQNSLRSHSLLSSCLALQLPKNQWLVRRKMGSPILPAQTDCTEPFVMMFYSPDSEFLRKKKKKAPNPRKHQSDKPWAHCEGWNTTSDKTQMSWWPWSSLSGHEGSSCCIWNWMGFNPCLPHSAAPIIANSRAGRALLLLLPNKRLCAVSWTNKPSWGQNPARTWLLCPSTSPPLPKAGIIPSCPNSPFLQVLEVCEHNQGFFPISRTWRIKPVQGSISPVPEGNLF